MNPSPTYSLGIPGQPWGEQEKAAWFANQKIQRSYQQQVVAKLADLPADFVVDQYGTLTYSSGTYPLFALRSRDWSDLKPTLLVTGGVHGYETSGVQGAIRFLQTAAHLYVSQFNIVVTPCVSPWGYETINRWAPNAVDPNRSFYPASPAQESAALMQYVASLPGRITVHIDLHETTDTDNSEFRPALAARDGVTNTNWNIPDGFYLVGDSQNPVPGFQQAIIEAVKKVTHIAPPDHDGQLIGVALEQEGVINYPTQKLNLCIGFTNAIYATTTEVYPDSPLVDAENCIVAQVAAITGGLDHVIAALGLRSVTAASLVIGSDIPHRR